jgi:hypothetical protein
MRNFNFPTPIAYICSTLVFFKDLIPTDMVVRVTLFITSCLQDPWVLPFPCESVDGCTHVEMAMPLFVAEITYHTIQHNTTDPDQTPTPKKEDDLFQKPI